MAAQRSPTPLSQGSSPWGYANLLGHCVMVAQQTLTLLA